jgi:ubiquinone/menaquinone biosynthesis C-methylase UbiE
VNCDAIAPFYRTIEYLAFGTRLQRHRLAFLNAAQGANTALVLGDGDGRFLAQLSAAYPALNIHCIELSAKMIALANHHQPNVLFVQADALQVPFPHNAYDIIYTHFFLDCFTSAQVIALAHKIRHATSPDARWIISDFRQAETGWRKLFTAAWLKTMYALFRLATNLQTQQLPDYHRALTENGFRLCEEKRSFAQLITSQLWRRT